MKQLVMSVFGVIGSTAIGAILGLGCQLILNQQGWLLFGTLAGFVGGGFWLAMTDPRK